MHVYELVVLCTDAVGVRLDDSTKRYFEADNDDEAKLVANSAKLHEKYSEFAGYFVRLTRIDNFAFYSEGNLQNPQKETHILRRYWPTQSTE